LQYAIMLASHAEGKVVLGHVVNPPEIPGSANPTSGWGAHRLSKRVQEKMKSLHEIISLEGIDVEEIIEEGDVKECLLKQIEKLKPTLIVLGRNTDRQPGRESLLTSLTQSTKVPILVVPRSHNPKIPNRAVLATDMKSFNLREFEPFIEVIKKSAQGLSVLNIRGGYSSDKDIAEWVNKFNTVYAMEAKVLNPQDDDVVKSMVKCVNTNNIDLLCTINRNPGLLDKLFSTPSTSLIATQVEVPVLLIRD
ncbi:MAG: universal stress protein, partial [Cyclobacteriaceae bacterium]|nr:universal stress protein [Cyclobacteriaceae bacterium]